MFEKVKGWVVTVVGLIAAIYTASGVVVPLWNQVKPDDRFRIGATMIGAFVAAAIAAGGFVFLSWSAIKTTRRKAAEYDDLTKAGHWSSPRVVGAHLVADSQPVLKLDPGLAVVEFILGVRNSSPFTQQIAHAELVEWAVYEGEQIILEGKAERFQKMVGALPPGGETMLRFTLTDTKREVSSRPQFVKLVAFLKIAVRSEELGVRDHEQALLDYGFVRDSRPETPSTVNLARMDELFKIVGQATNGSKWERDLTWQQIFALLLYDPRPCWEDDAKERLCDLLGLRSLREDVFVRIRAQAVAQKFWEVTYKLTPSGYSTALSVLPAGYRFHVEQMTVKTASTPCAEQDATTERNDVG